MNSCSFVICFVELLHISFAEKIVSMIFALVSCHYSNCILRQRAKHDTNLHISKWLFIVSNFPSREKC